MTKYRLKLPLPGVPAGTESNPSGNNHHIYSGPIHAFSFSSTEMDNMPDFFEKVEEKEILLVTEDGAEIRQEDELWHVYMDCNRLVQWDWYKEYTKEVIKREFIDYGWNFFSTKQAAEDYIKSRKPKVIFTTYDKIDICENTVGSVFGICIDSKTDIWLERKLPWTSKNGIFAENRVWFYYADKAKEYLVCNYPCLSNNEINCDPLNTRKLVRNKLKALLPDIF